MRYLSYSGKAGQGQPRTRGPPYKGSVGIGGRRKSLGSGAGSGFLGESNSTDGCGVCSGWAGGLGFENRLLTRAVPLSERTDRRRGVRPTLGINQSAQRSYQASRGLSGPQTILVAVGSPFRVWCSLPVAFDISTHTPLSSSTNPAGASTMTVRQMQYSQSYSRLADRVSFGIHFVCSRGPFPRVVGHCGAPKHWGQGFP